MPVPTDPYPDFINNVTDADGDQVDARFKALYDALNPAAVGLAAVNVQARGLTDAVLASPTNQVWKTIARQSLFLGAASGAGVAYRDHTGTARLSAVAEFLPEMLLSLPYDVNEYAVPGLTPKLRVKGIVLAGNPKPAVNFAFSLYSITVGATNTTTLSGVVGGPTPTVTDPAAGTFAAVVSSEFNLPGAGNIYVLGAAISGGATAAGSKTVLEMMLQLRHV